MTSIITCSHVDLGYDGHVIVKDLNMKIEQGAYVSVIGQNGSGKSTFIKTLLGLVRPVSGKSRAVFREKASDISHSRRKCRKTFRQLPWKWFCQGF